MLHTSDWQKLKKSNIVYCCKIGREKFSYIPTDGNVNCYGLFGNNLAAFMKIKKTCMYVCVPFKPLVLVLGVLQIQHQDAGKIIFFAVLFMLQQTKENRKQNEWTSKGKC